MTLAVTLDSAYSADLVIVTPPACMHMRMRALDRLRPLSKQLAPYHPFLHQKNNKHSKMTSKLQFVRYINYRSS